ncbi:MAG TPA: hypothetical protein PK735_01830 [Flavobacteriales bacterium]|nr:hypothetical protein [Flavobacteriales bacterium]
MKQSILFIICALGLSSISAQALIVLPVDDDTHTIEFNPAFIKSNSITSIVGNKMVKRSNEPMRPNGSLYYYRFDGKGRTVYSNNAFGHPGSGRDTASVKYIYDEADRITQRLRNDLGGHYTYTIDYDDNGKPERETYSRIENLGTDRYNVIPGEVTVISDERFRYEVQSDSLTKKLFLNNLDLPYREQLIVKDSHGYLRTIEDVYLMSNKRARITFKYDDKGRLAERLEQPDIGWLHSTKHTFTYDNVGNLLQAILWKDDVQKELAEYLYEEGSMTLSARIAKDMETGQIHIVKYVTERR